MSIYLYACTSEEIFVLGLCILVIHFNIVSNDSHSTWPLTRFRIGPKLDNFVDKLCKIHRFDGELGKSQKSLQPFACACFGDSDGGLLESSGCLRAYFAQNVSLQKSAQTLRLCMFATNLKKLTAFVGTLRKSPKSLKRYASACLGDFIWDLLDSSGCPQASFAQNGSLQKSLKCHACACLLPISVILENSLTTCASR